MLRELTVNGIMAAVIAAGENILLANVPIEKVASEHFVTTVVVHAKYPVTVIAKYTDRLCTHPAGLKRVVITLALVGIKRAVFPAWSDTDIAPIFVIAIHAVGTHKRIRQLKFSTLPAGIGECQSGRASTQVIFTRFIRQGGAVVI